jgi:hypothetical protein
MLIGEIVEGDLLDGFVGASIGLIVDAQPPFLLHRLALVVEVVLDDRQRAHAIGLEKQRRVELVRRHGFEVQRPLLVGRAVDRAAVADDGEQVLAGADVLGALEHHVLEQVGEAGASDALVARADVVGDGDGEYRRRVVLRDDHAQPVLQPRVGELDGRSRDGADGCGTHRDDDGEHSGCRRARHGALKK